MIYWFISQTTEVLNHIIYFQIKRVRAARLLWSQSAEALRSQTDLETVLKWNCSC